MRSRKLHYDTYPRQAGVNHMNKFLESWNEPSTDTGTTNASPPTNKPVGNDTDVVPENV